ncbi:hypothetical protein EV641_109170 [Rhodococcus sp. SMB37]|nr:hypothetical protein EV641_109170 [Rhodococcus sp. SMB37]
MNIPMGMEATAEVEKSSDPDLWAEAMATQDDDEGGN